MKQNEEKLDQMVKAVIKVFYPAPTKEICDRKQFEDEAKLIRTALAPFCMEMTDEEIERESKLYYKPHGSNIDIESFRKGVYTGAKFMRDNYGK